MSCKSRTASYLAPAPRGQTVNSDRVNLMLTKSINDPHTDSSAHVHDSAESGAARSGHRELRPPDEHAADTDYLPTCSTTEYDADSTETDRTRMQARRQLLTAGGVQRGSVPKVLN